MTDQHPITPPPELAEKLWSVLRKQTQLSDAGKAWNSVIALAYAAGADQELEACCAEICTVYGKRQADWLSSMRRPKPPSLAEQALLAIEEEQADVALVNYKVIRAALERLQELEACVAWVDDETYGTASDAPRAARRPTSSLKEQALSQLECIQSDLTRYGMGISTATIRAALELVPDAPAVTPDPAPTAEAS